MNNVIRRPGQQVLAPPQPGTRDGNWVWDGSNWVCDPDCDNGFPQPFPPFGPPVFSGPVGQPPWYPGANGGVSFGATFPPNPVRGHLFWDGKTFWLFDGAAWVSVGGMQAAGGGSVTPPSGTPPANPVPGQQWFNGTALFVWDGNAWIPVSQTKTTISATAPPAPNPGDLWFDGTQLHIWDGSAWELVGPGATVGPVPTTTKVFQLTMAGTSLALGTSGLNNWAIVPFTSTPQIDTENGWNGTLHKYTPAKAGYYMFFINQWQAIGDATGSGHALLLNDAGSWQPNSQNYVSQFVSFGGGTQGTELTSSGIVHMNGTTDFVRLWAMSTTGSFYQLSTTMPSITGFLMP
jgi:hypothetical protein